MKIKTKLNLGVGLLFVIIIILSLISAYSVFFDKSGHSKHFKSKLQHAKVFSQYVTFIGK